MSNATCRPNSRRAGALTLGSSAISEVIAEIRGLTKRAGRFRRTPECAYVSAVEVARCP